MDNIISLEKIEKYLDLTERALTEVKKRIIKGKESEAKEIINMVENYISDSRHFMKNKEFVNSFGAINYAHGWIDAGVRLGIFEVKDSDLFTIR